MSNNIITGKGSITKNKGKLSYTYSPLLNLVKKTVSSSGEISNEQIEPFNTQKLKLDLNHPVLLEPLYSYDGSVDLIFTDDKNTPKLVNSRFRVSENELYEIVSRLGNKVENIYNEDILESEISLQKTSNSLPKILLLSCTNNGELSVGNYIFYIKYSDGDGNLTDIVAESGVISCFKGIDNAPKTINGGYRNLNSNKAIILEFSNLDPSYLKLKLYYSRETGDINLNGVSSYFEIIEEFPYNLSSVKIRITGLEPTKEITESDLNILYFTIEKSKALAQALNRLFLGNISSPVDPVKDLTNISLFFLPELNSLDKDYLIGNVSTKSYDKDTNTSAEYYSTNNIYNFTGYWNEEIYRFGIVYIYKEGGLSNVYNVRGIKELTNSTTFTLWEYDPDNPLTVDSNHLIIGGNDENDCGVIRIVDNSINTSKVYGIKFKITNLSNIENIQKKLDSLGIIGYFFVRQKRIPTILGLAVLLNTSGNGNNPVVNIPLLPNGKYESFIDKLGNIVHDYEKRLRDITSNLNFVKAGICPEYNLNLPYYNTLFNGDLLPYKIVGKSSFSKNDRHYYLEYNTNLGVYNILTANILGIPDNTKTMAINNIKFNGVAGVESEAYRVGFVGEKAYITFDKDYDKDPLKTPQIIENCNIVRGIFGPYLGLTNIDADLFDTINIYIPGYDINSIDDYFKIRYDDKSTYYAISDRLSIYDNFPVCYRGDCYICNYTWRVNRNFLDSSAPTNDKIVDSLSFRKYYNTDPKHVDVLANINRNDVNAVELGSWITVKVCCSRNISLRAVDESYADEKGLTNHYRSFYPLVKMSTGGDWKIPESFVLNDGYGKTVGHRWNSKLDNVRYLNTDYTNRIIYSNIKETNAYSNAYRVFEAKNYRDYNMERGAITKLIEVDGNLICVFEHGVAWININERVQTAGLTGAEVFLNSNKVLPEKLQFLSSSYGSLYADSVIKVASGKIYGVDTTAKKVWMISGNQFKLISDLVIGEFLNENIPLREHDVEVIIGSKNVKTHYNSFKGDVMFTFYIPEKGGNKFETAWNLCWNDLLQEWVTFYSWIPQQTACINNVMYSFDRNYARLLNYYLPFKEKYKIKGTNLKDKICKTIIELAKDEEVLSANKLCRIAFGLDNYNELLNTEDDKVKLICDNAIYKHGFGGIIDNLEKIKPCKWYNRQHPFEFEFVVNDTPLAHKIFNNLRILSNKAEPESFHYEIIGECYDFAEDKDTMYYRLEAKKLLFRNLGSNISFDNNYSIDVIPILNKKSTDTVWYYSREDTDQNVEDSYLELLDSEGKKNYKNLSGTEVIHYNKMNEFRLWQHDGAYDIRKYGRLRGNMLYLEDFWLVLINPIIVVEKNEDIWHNDVPNLDLANAKLPNDLTKTNIREEDLPEKYTLENIDKNKWKNWREIKLKDKWMRVRIRYSGKDLTMISALYTMYSISYA